MIANRLYSGGLQLLLLFHMNIFSGELYTVPKI